FWDDLLNKAGKLLEGKTDYLVNNLNGLSEDDVAVIAYSAGATGNPKGVRLTHKNLIAAAKNLIQIDNMTEKDDYLSFQPLAWVNEQVMSIVIPLHTGNIVNF